MFLFLNILGLFVHGRTIPRGFPSQFLPDSSGGMAGGSVPGGPPDHLPDLCGLTTTSEEGIDESSSNRLSMDGNHESHDRAMIILKAPSPGGPVEVFDIPDSPGGPVEVEGLGVPEEEEESSQVVPGPSVDLSRPSSSSPAPAPKGPESWRNWKPKKQFPQTSQEDLPETRTFFLKGAGKRWEPVNYNPQKILYEEGACKNIADAILQILREADFPYGKTKNPKALLGIIKNLTNPNGHIYVRIGWNRI